MYKLLLSLFSSIALLTSGKAASIVWNAASDAGISLPNGNMVPVGNLARMGVFDIPDSTISENRFDLAFLDSHFTQLDKVQIGGSQVGNNPGYWNAGTDTVNTLPPSDLGGKQIYVWAFASGTPSADVATTLATATHHAIFYADKATIPNWTVPTDTIIVPGSTQFDIGDLTGFGSPANGMLTAAARVIVGNDPAINGPNGALNASNLALMAIPEPATAGLLALGGLALFGRRRR